MLKNILQLCQRWPPDCPKNCQNCQKLSKLSQNITYYQNRLDSLTQWQGHVWTAKNNQIQPSPKDKSNDWTWLGNKYKYSANLMGFACPCSAWNSAENPQKNWSLNMYGNCIFLAQCHNIHSGSLLQFTSCITTIISAISIVESDNNLQKWGQDKII